MTWTSGVDLCDAQEDLAVESTWILIDELPITESGMSWTRTEMTGTSEEAALATDLRKQLSGAEGKQESKHTANG